VVSKTTLESGFVGDPDNILHF